MEEICTGLKYIFLKKMQLNHIVVSSTTKRKVDKFYIKKKLIKHTIGTMKSPQPTGPV